MTLLEWIRKKQPGKIIRLDDRVEVEHAEGSTSTLWLNRNIEVPAPLKSLGEIFEVYNGIDLFSSAFKIASIHDSQYSGEVPITFSLEKIKSEFEFCKPVLPEAGIPFMKEAGIGIYALGLESFEIYKWDTSYDEMTGKYKNLFEILDEWLSAFEDWPG